MKQELDNLKGKNIEIEEFMHKKLEQVYRYGIVAVVGLLVLNAILSFIIQQFKAKSNSS